MAKLPSGWIFIPRFTDVSHIELVERKLITCQECKHFDGETYELNNVQGMCFKAGMVVRPGFWCADGEANDDGP